MGSILKYLEDRKTYLLSGVLLIAVLLLVFFGRMSPATAVPFGIAAVFACGLRAVLQKHHDEVLTLLMAVANAGVAYREHNGKALASAADAAIQDGETLAGEIREEETHS